MAALQRGHRENIRLLESSMVGVGIATMQRRHWDDIKLSEISMAVGNKGAKKFKDRNWMQRVRSRKGSRQEECML